MSAHEHLSDGHLSDDVLIDGLYGLAAANASIDINAHVRECPACASRWNELREQRAVIAAPVEVGADVLAAQRRNIYRRIEHASPWEHASRWAGPAVVAVTACGLAIGVFVHNPQAPARAGIPTAIPAVISDTQLYSDVYSMEQSFEPSTAASLRVLFEPDDSAIDGANQAADPGVKPGIKQQ